MNCVSFYRNEGCYNLCNTKEKSAQYVFNWGKFNEKANEFGLQRSFLVDIEEDCNYDFPTYDSLELANELDSIISSHWIDTNKPSIKKLVDFLESIQEENKVEMCEDMISDYQKRLEEWQDKLFSAQYDLKQKRYYDRLEL
jgi:hypothetical protein